VGASPFQGWPFWPYENLVSAERGYRKIFVHGGAFFFGRLRLFPARTAAGDDGEFSLYTWNMWWPQISEPYVLEHLPFKVRATCS